MSIERQRNYIIKNWKELQHRTKVCYASSLYFVYPFLGITESDPDPDLHHSETKIRII